MTQQATERNPFLLMVSPEVVLAAMEKSEHLGLLNRHLCRPLDRLPAAVAGASASSEEESDDEGPAEIGDSDIVR